ncbi:MAG: hypothetical protein WDN00_02610 [Limisphaerales bacterium]
MPPGPIKVWFSQRQPASPVSITGLVAGVESPVINLAQHAPHVVRGAIAHEHREPLQLFRRLPQTAASRRIKIAASSSASKRLGVGP